MKNDKQFTAVEDEMMKLAEKMYAVSGHMFSRSRLQYNAPPIYSIWRNQQNEEEHKEHGHRVPVQGGLTLEQAITTLTQLYFAQLTKIQQADIELKTMDIHNPANRKNYELLAKWSKLQDERDAMTFGLNVEQYRCQKEGKKNDARYRRMEREMMAV